MADCLSEVQKYLITTLYRSGKSIDQSGLYEDCISDSSFRYFFLLFANNGAKASNRAFLGLCTPSICEKEEITNSVDNFFKEVGMPLHVFKITEPSKYSYEMNWAFMFIVAWLGILLLSVIVGTIVKAFNKKSNKIVDCFALQQNMKIFAARESSLKFFNGIKGLCLFWIILGHSFSIRVIDSQNWVTLNNQFQKFINLIPLGAFFAVDIFFLLGGFLLGYIFLTAMKKNTVKLYLMAILHRLLRFYPSYITAMLIWYQLFPQSGSGPFWPMQQFYVDPCKNMWRNILFIDNLYESIQCMPWAWYLSNDVQLFILCIWILFLYTRQPKLALIVSGLLIFGSVLFNFLSSQAHNYFTIAHVYDLFKWNDYFLNMYIKPWSRAPPYIIGLFLGTEYYKFFRYTKNKKENLLSEDESEPLFEKIRIKYVNQPFWRYFGYFVGFGVLFMVVLLPRDLQVGHEWPQVGHSSYLAFSKILFVLAVTIIIMPAVVGIPDFIAFLGDTTFFSIIGKISFWAYLIHYMVIMRNSYNLKYTLYFTPLEIYQRYVTDLVISLVLAFVFTMVVEAPFVKLEKLLLQGGGGKRKQNAKESLLSKDTVISTSNVTG